MYLTYLMLMINMGISNQLDYISFDQKMNEAKDSNKHVLLVFSGSDWCKPCIQFKKNVLDSQEFRAYADSKLVIYVADFPYSKKNRLPKAQTEQNEALAEKYNPNGEFPSVSLIDPDSQKSSQIGTSNMKNTQGFLQDVQRIIDLP